MMVISMPEKVSQVIREYWEAPLPSIKNRDIVLRLDGDLINDIIGPRRAGKTYLMFLTIMRLLEEHKKESTIYLNFENRKLLPPNGSHFNDIIEFIHAEDLIERFGKVSIFLDEVHRVNGWERYVRSIYDEFKGKVKIFISGSSSDLLGKDYSKLLTGRHFTITVLPLSFKEYLDFKAIGTDPAQMTESTEARVKKELKEYLKFGGFPEIVLNKDPGPMVAQLLTDLISRDILSRSNVRNKVAIEEFANFLATNVSSLLSFGKMSKYLNGMGVKISVPTLITYFKYMKDAFLFFDNTIFSYKIKDQMQNPRKIYCIDNGLANSGSSDLGERMGSLCENTVAVELLRRGLRTNYWKDGNEVDFIVRKGRVLDPIQVCYDIRSPITKERETKALKKCMDALNVNHGRIITYDIEASEKADHKRIDMVPLWKFLLNPDPDIGRT